MIFQGIQKKSRDNTRKDNLLQIKEALDIHYKGAGNKKYPTQKEWKCMDDNNSIDSLVSLSIMTSIPNDPSIGSCYYYMSDGEDYKLGAQMEANTEIMKGDNGSSDLLYEIYTTKAHNWPL